MQREWNPKSFFRSLTAGVIELFTKSVGLAIDSAGRGSPGAQLYEAWKALPADQRQRLEERLLPVNDMCSPHARSYLEEIAQAHWTNGRSALFDASKGWSAQDLALRVFLDDPRAFDDAHKDYVVDTMTNGKEYRGRRPVAVTPSPLKKQRFAQELQRYFRDTAFGAHCQVEDHANDEKLAVFVYHEDEVTPLERFNDQGALATTWQRPVLKMVAVFHFASSTLHVKAGRKAEREKLRDLFAQLYAGDAGFFEDAPRFSFDALRQETFRFPVQPTDKIDNVSVVKVVARPASARTKRVTVELQRGLKMHEVHEELDVRGIDVASDAIDGVQLCFEFQGAGRSRTRTVTVFAPNTTNLQDTPRDRVIRHYLRMWGIDVTVRKAAVVAPALEAAAG
jgi:hypothetical protein